MARSVSSVAAADGGPAGDDPDRATGRSYVSELGRFRDGGSQLNYAVYHDNYRRTGSGRRFASREYRFVYVDETPLPGRATALPDPVTD